MVIDGGCPCCHMPVSRTYNGQGQCIKTYCINCQLIFITELTRTYQPSTADGHWSNGFQPPNLDDVYRELDEQKQREFDEQ